jgi:fructan beta-fructosidase
LMIGWMNNWQYANQIPTAPWRSAMSIPREIGLRTIDGSVRLVQRPIHELRKLRKSRQSYKRRHLTVREGNWALPARGKTLEITAELRPGNAERSGLKVRVGNGEETVIGYDAASKEVYVDRTRSGDVGFSRAFPGVHRAPLAARHGKVRLRILVDWSSVEVFGDRGQAVITDQIFPRATSEDIELFAEGGTARVDSLRIHSLRSSWTRRR